jgi:hypothetical protein
MSETSERVHLEPADALAMVKEGEYVHTFRQSAHGMLIGADWPRARIEEVLAVHPAELAGEMATGMGHGLVVHDEHGWLFIATRKEYGENADG